MTDKKQTIRWLFQAAGSHRFKAVTAMVLATVSAILAVVPMVCVYLIAQHIFETGNVAMERLLWLAGGAAISIVVRNGLYLVAMVCSHSCAFGVHYALRARIATHIASLPMGFFDQRSSGEIKKSMGEDVDNVELFFAHYLPDIVSAAVLPLFSLGLLLWVNPLLTVAALLPLPIAAVMHIKMNKAYHTNVGPFHDNAETMNNAIVEYVRGMQVVKAFNRTAHSFGRYKESLGKHLGIAEEWSGQVSGYASVFWTCLDIGLLFILPLAFVLYNNGQISGAELVLFLLLGPGTMEPLGRVIMIAGMLDRIEEGVVRIRKILNHTPLSTSTTPKKPADFSIQFENTYFAYRDEDVLHNVSFTLPGGTVTGLIGPSGAGKSTIARLAARFWDVRQGRILIGGVNIKDIPTCELMKNIAFVFQDTYLMNDTIMENLRMGNPQATDEAVMAAAKGAAAHDFIMELEEGYQTRAGEGGARLSGGEKQRISIARAILKNAPILILDEITSATDPENEHHIHTALNKLIKNKTVVIIAHKLPTVMHADQLLLFENGRLRNTGRHEDMLADGLYHSLWNACTVSKDWSIVTDGAEK